MLILYFLWKVFNRLLRISETTEGIEGIIDLANLKDESRTKIEALPDDFFQLTYPTSDVKKVLDEINTRFSSSKESSGLFFFSRA